MKILEERQLTLSGKKTRIGAIKKGFHFLGINYPGTQSPDNTTVTQAHKLSVYPCDFAHYSPLLGGGDN